MGGAGWVDPGWPGLACASLGGAELARPGSGTISSLHYFIISLFPLSHYFIMFIRAWLGWAGLGCSPPARSFFSSKSPPPSPSPIIPLRTIPFSHYSIISLFPFPHYSIIPLFHYSRFPIIALFNKMSIISFSHYFTPPLQDIHYSLFHYFIISLCPLFHYSIISFF